jgi:hypothetical protein
MKTIQLTILALALGSPAGMAGDCSGPQAPSLPDGATASMEDMLAGQKAVKEYQAANLEYMGCLEKAFTAAEAAALESTSEDEKKAAQDNYQNAVDAYNAAVSQEEEIAGQFNTEIREYKAANPG